MGSDLTSDLDHAFELIGDGDCATASIIVDRILADDPNHPYGLLAWGQIHLASGDVDRAIDAHEAAVQFAPVDANVHFALAESLRARAEGESPYFRGPTWARARRLAEQGLYLDPDNEAGRTLLLEIIEQQLADEDETRDETPNEVLRPHRPRGLEVRAPRQTNPAVPAYLALVSTITFWRALWWLGPSVLIGTWLVWSWVSPAFTWFNLAVTFLMVYGTLVVFRAWLGPRIEARRRHIDF